MTEHFTRSTISADEAPEGCRYEWVPAGEEWRLEDESGRVCSFLRCQNPAVVILRRPARTSRLRPNLPGYRWWHYCADHMYGRKIEDGIVKSRILVKTEPA